MTRVALVSHWDWVLYNFRLPLARRLRARGLDVTFVSPRGDYVDALQGAGFGWLPWPLSRRGMNPVDETASLLRLAALYRRHRFAAVQHFTIKPILYGSLSAAMARTPAVINTFTGLGFLFSDDRRARGLRRLVFPLLRRLLHRGSTHTVFQNQADRARLVSDGLVPVERTHVIPGSGVDVKKFMPAAARPGAMRSAGDGEVIVLMAGRLLFDKGISEFVDSARKLQGGRVKTRFWIAGKPDHGNPRCVPADVLDRWRREGVIELLGHRDDMPELLQQASIAVLPSYHEGVPRFLLEAAASGLPLVGTDIDGCRTVIRDGVNGLLVPPRDVESLTRAISRLVGDPGLRARMGAASRDVAVAEFEEEAILDGYEAVYRRLGVVA